MRLRGDLLNWAKDVSNFQFDFASEVPVLNYRFNKKEMGEIFARRNELKKHFSSTDTINKLLWLWFGIDDKTFEYLCAYFIEREFGFATDIRGGFSDCGIDVSGCRGTKDNPEFIAIQCKQWNAWKINEKGIFTIYNKMAHAKDEHNAKLVLATINYVDYSAWEAIEDKMEIWDYRTILDYYDKYFLDPNAEWEAFLCFIDRKKMEHLLLKQQKEHEELEISMDRQKIRTQRESVAERSNMNFQILRDVRKKEAMKHGIYPNYVFSDAILYEMIKRHPQTKLEFLQISWIGEEKYKKHCTAFTEAIKTFRE